MNVGICVFFFQAEDGIRDLVRSRGLGDVYKRQEYERSEYTEPKDHMSNLVVAYMRAWSKFGPNYAYHNELVG